MKSEVLNVTTPICQFQYTWLVEPDTQYEPMWKVTCLIKPEEAKEIEEQLTGLLDRWKQQLKAENPNTKYKLGTQPWSYEEVDGTPFFVIKTKMKVGGVRKDGSSWKNRPPALFNSEGKAMTEEEKQTVNKCGPGTEGQVNLRCSGYEGGFGVGIKIQPEAAIIRKHVEYVKTAEGYGFEASSEKAEESSEACSVVTSVVSAGDEF